MREKERKKDIGLLLQDMMIHMMRNVNKNCDISLSSAGHIREARFSP